MDCLKCNLSYDQNANFCQKCGSNLNEFESLSSTNPNPSSDLKLLCFLIGIELVISVLWMTFSKIITFYKDFNYSITTIYTYAAWLVGIITFITFLIAIINIKNEKIRTFLIICLSIKVLLIFSTFVSKLL